MAVSLTGAQAGIITDTVHTAAKIVEIRAQRVREVLDQNRIPIIAGYQGITTDKNISTLGRGGTDATAVGLAIALGAERVEFMKDVDGVQSADPKLIPTARVIDEISYEETLEMMGCGAKILQVPAVEMAVEYGVKLAVGNSKTGVAGTILTDRPLGRRTLTAVVLAPARALPPVRFHERPRSSRDPAARAGARAAAGRAVGGQGPAGPAARGRYRALIFSTSRTCRTKSCRWSA